MSKKIDRAVNGPGWAEVILGAALSAVLGVVLGALLLVLKPVVVLKVMPKEEDRMRGAVYYVQGSRDTAKAKQALLKRKAFAEGQSVTVTEDEINSLVAPAAPGAPAAPAPAAPAPKAAAEKAKAPEKKAGEKAAPAAPAGDVLATGAPNVRIDAGVLQVGVPININVLGVGQTVLVQARGGFVKQGAVFTFEPSAMYLGSCPVDRLPFLAGYVRDKFLAAQAIPEDIATSWAKLANVTIEGKSLKLAMP